MIFLKHKPDLRDPRHPLNCVLQNKHRFPVGLQTVSRPVLFASHPTISLFPSPHFLLLHIEQSSFLKSQSMSLLCSLALTMSISLCIFAYPVPIITCMFVCAAAHIWRPKDKFQEFLVFHLVGEVGSLLFLQAACCILQAKRQISFRVIFMSLPPVP